MDDIIQVLKYDLAFGNTVGNVFLFAFCLLISFALAKVAQTLFQGRFFGVQYQG